MVLHPATLNPRPLPAVSYGDVITPGCATKHRVLARGRVQSQGLILKTGPEHVGVLRPSFREKPLVPAE